MHACMHVHAYIHTYIHTYIHVYGLSMCMFCSYVSFRYSLVIYVCPVIICHYMLYIYTYIYIYTFVACFSVKLTVCVLLVYVLSIVFRFYDCTQSLIYKDTLPPINPASMEVHKRLFERHFHVSGREGIGIKCKIPWQLRICSCSRIEPRK